MSFSPLLGFRLKLLAGFHSVLAYFDSDEPRAAAAGSVALLIAGNQPFYPLYVALVVGAHFWPSLLTLLSAPFFIAVPAVCRRWPVSGRCLLLGASVGNTLLASFALGPKTLVELFYVPCLLLTLLIFNGRQRWLSLAACGLACLAGILIVHGCDLGGFTPYDAPRLSSLVRLHVASVTGLVLMLGYFAYRIPNR
jgi:hypothetical protein